ncbi:MAG: hypothetical protein AB7P14_23170 [Blastocatellales bacterium]
MRIIDFLLGIWGLIVDFVNAFGVLLAKIATAITAIAGAVKGFFMWKAKKLERQRWDDPYDFGSFERKTNTGFRAIGWVIILLCVLFLGSYWWWHNTNGGSEKDVISNLLVRNDSPKALIQNYYGFLRSENYESAWKLIDSRARQKIFPGGPEEFKAKWEMRKNIKLINVATKDQSESEALVSASLTWLASNSGASFVADATCNVGRETKGEKWIIYACQESFRYAPPVR